MAIRDIVVFPHPVLKQRCAEVTEFDATLHSLLDDMSDTMHKADGIGLAANQIGVSARVFLMDVPVNRGGSREERKAQAKAEAESNQPPPSTGRIEVINPKIVARRGELRYEEGCLSFPGMSEWVNRAAEIDLVYQDRTGTEQALSATGLVAVCIQHELDHLDGITFFDRLSTLKRKIALREHLRQNRDLIEDQALRDKAKQKRAG